MGLVVTIKSGILRGTICLWYGNIASIPSGWALCNGSNGTPDLRNRFIVCANADVAGVAKSTVLGAAAQTGDTSTHLHNADLSEDGVLNSGIAIANVTPAGSYQHTYNGLASGDTYTTKTIPPFYALAYIMKL